MRAPQVLVPFDKREAIPLVSAAKLAGRSEATLRTWCNQHFIGRRVAGGPWCVSRVALAMLLDGDAAALRAYHSGDRHGPMVSAYYQRLGLSPVLRDWKCVSSCPPNPRGWPDFGPNFD
jgi:hypothetical protein